MSARDEMLRRIRTALVDRPAPAPVRRDYRAAGTVGADVEFFAERVADYRANVHRVADVAACLATLVPVAVVPDGFPDEWLPDSTILRDSGQDAHELDRVPAVITTCALAVAETGTIVLDHSAGQGRRALTLVPDHHVVVVRADQVVADVPDAIAALDPGRPLTWISGPSATSDIELNRVEGVHGPRVLDVVLVSAT